MRAVVYEEFGPPEVLRLADVDTPVPNDTDVLIRVHATTVTTGDCNARGFVFVPHGFGLVARMTFGFSRPKKQILGIEFAGEIAAVGGQVTTFKAGDRVFGIDGVRLGAYAGYKCMPEDAGLIRMPETLTFIEAASIPNGALTALTFLKNIGAVQRDERVLIIGASGSVGSAAVQLARHFGAVVAGVCSSGNVQLVTSLGADTVIDYTKEDFTASGEHYDIIFDTVGKSSFVACRDSLTRAGRYLASAGGLREFAQMAWTSLLGTRKVKAGISSERAGDLAFIRDLVEKGAFRPVIDRRYPLEEIVEAHRYVDTGHKKGNVVITVGHT